MFLDSHAHLDVEVYRDNLDEVLQRAWAQDLVAVLCPSTEVETWERNLELLEREPRLYGFIGLHPHDARRWDTTLETRLWQILEHPKMIAVGEIGLDYFYDYSPRETQRTVLRWQLRLAREKGYPVILHLREAAEDMLRILREERDGAYAGVVHCFSDTLETAQELLAMGFHLSFTGNITFPKAAAIRQVAAVLPPERVLIETDSPYLAPSPPRKWPNEPARVIQVARQLAELWEWEVEEVGRVTTENAVRLFNLPEKVLA
jgi:TatD DNase family protein